MKSIKVAARYAKALLELAIENKKVDSVSGEMHFFLQTNNETKGFELLISSSIIQSDKMISVFKMIFEHF